MLRQSQASRAAESAGVAGSNPVRRPLRRAIVVALLLLLVLVPAGFAGLGRWLMVEDPPEPGRAIVVLSGHLPFRAMEAARLYHEGLAPEVWLTRGVRPAEDQALRRLGVEVPGEETYSAQVLKRLGVPEGSIRVLDEPVLNTQDEVRAIAQELKRRQADRAIVVTSKASSRRTRMIWRSLAGDTPRASIRYAGQDPYDPARWWRNTWDIQDVTHEVMGILNVCLGLRVRPNRPQRTE